MRLPTHVTGLTRELRDLKKMDGVLFKRLGYEIARKLNGKVVDFIEPKYPLNYFRLDIMVEGDEKSILLHEFFPYVAVTEYENELRIVFLDDEKIMSELRKHYVVLEKKFLNEIFKEEQHDLSEFELKNAKHWRPNTNGQVIFNCWD